MTTKNIKQKTVDFIQITRYYLGLVLVDFSFFISVLVRPVTLIVAVFTTLVLFYAQTQQNTNRVIFEIIAAVSGGILGGLITEKIIQLTGNSYIVKKSVGAIRNLQLIKFKVANVNERILVLKNKVNARDFEEIENLVDNIHKDILNSIGDWGDVNPNSEAIKDYYELLAQRQGEIKKVTKEKENLELKYKQLESINTEERAKLKKEIDDKEKKIDSLITQVDRLNKSGLEIETGSFLSSPTISGVGTMSGGTVSQQQCTNCRRFYIPTFLSQYSTDPTLCDDCRRRKI